MALMSTNVLFLLNRYGTEVTLSKPTFGSYDPTTGTVSSTTTDTYTVQCYMADYNLSEINNDSVVMGDRKAYFPPNDTSGVAIPKPDVEDTIDGLGDKVKIVRVQELYSADTLVCYICQVRE